MKNRSHFQKKLKNEFLFEDIVKLVVGTDFEPGSVTAFVQKDETKVFEDVRKRLCDPFGGMGIVVAMDGDYGTSDSLPQL